MIHKSHFTEQEVAQCADAINEGTYFQLPQSLRSHLSECDQCASEVLFIADIAFDFTVQHQIKQTKNSKKRIILFSTSAAAIFIAILLVKMIQTDPNTSSNNNLLSSFDTTNRNDFLYSDTTNVYAHKQQSEKTIALLEPSHKLEKLYQNHQQNYRDKLVQVITLGAVNYPNKDSLKWINNNNEKLTIEFFDNKEHKIISLETKDSAVKIPLLPNGIYYWKLINEDFDLLYVGKIKVKQP